jgi:hypothetical protein
MVAILSAKFGDETSSTDVRKTLEDRIKKDGRDFSIPVDSSIVPVYARLTGAGKVSLTDDEKNEINGMAESICGGTSDQVCMEIKIQELSASKLQDKEKASNRSIDIVKGRRLTVTYRDESGRTQTVMIPEGQTFSMTGNVKPDPGFDYEAALSPYKDMANQIWGIIGASVLAFLYVASIVITWVTYREYNNLVLRIAMTAIAVFIPIIGGLGVSTFPVAIAAFLRVEKIAREKVDALQ